MIPRNSRHAILLTLVISTFTASFARAQYPALGLLKIETSTGKTLATYSSRELNSAFQTESYQTLTPWTANTERITFRGPALGAVLARHGLAQRAAVQLIAYDDFITEITQEEIRKYSPILAVERNCTKQDVERNTCAPGQQFRPLSMDEFGPVYLVWPFEKLPYNYVPGRNSIWVWFVVAIR
ncbi:hypothetical protein [Ochrobactrum quorumnocens]|uniref:Oxidoreductase molybdopterin-binding domain-containing protein n=1 Tax=Ochrobactrum quorumnocens TaxID=271865 RepID=A0A5N1JWE7_9HYPH|nr:hypothetical protein [[Ochrobactrum] quorumnocens]KAA9368346.1 hypothetical protein F3W84_10685 [[Ochrobactrum] quorumnocens]